MNASSQHVIIYLYYFYERFITFGEGGLIYEHTFKKAAAVLLSVAMILPVGMGAAPADAREESQIVQRKQGYLVQTISEKKLEALDEIYEESETVSELGEDSMKEDGFTALELTEKQADRLEKDSGVAIVEPDVMVQASSKSGAGKKTAVHKKMHKGTEWNLQAIRCDEEKKRRMRKIKSGWH